MSFEQEMNELIQRYLKEIKNEELSIEEILSRPRWKRVLFFHKAKEHYEGYKPTDFTLDEYKAIYGE